MSDVHDWLRVLDLEPGASFEEIRRAHRDMAKVWHPDRFPNDPRLRLKAEQQQKALNEAFGNLERWVKSGRPLPLGANDAHPPMPAPAPMRGPAPVHSRNPMQDTWTVRPPLGYRGGIKRVRRRRRRRVGRLFGAAMILMGLGFLAALVVALVL